LLGEPDGDEEDDAPDDEERVQDEHRAHVPVEFFSKSVSPASVSPSAAASPCVSF
jgi:hypothetical protein